MTITNSCREQEQIQTNSKPNVLADYNSFIPDDILNTFMSNMASSLFNNKSSELTDNHILKSIDFHTKNLNIEKKMSSEILNAFKMYSSAHSKNARLSYENERSQIQSDFLAEFRVRFDNSKSIGS